MDQTNKACVGYAPAHITGFFQIFPDGSTGAGLNPALGAVTEVRSTAEAGRLEIEINGRPAEAPVSRRVVRLFADGEPEFGLAISHRIDYPIGYGMGMSAAGAFSLALALNEALGAGKSYDECMQAARQADIACGTGLGDVVAQQFPGVMMGLPPYPSTAVKQLEHDAQYVTCAFFEPLETASIIKDETWKKAINDSGAHCMRELSECCTLERFIDLSRRFSLDTGLASEQVRHVMEHVPQCSMAMLGQTVFILSDDAETGIALLSPFSDRVITSRLAERGAGLL